MKKAPIVPRNEEQKMKLSDLVQRILNKPDSSEGVDIEQEIDQIERKIDELVYEVYKLTPAEIALIEEESNP